MADSFALVPAQQRVLVAHNAYQHRGGEDAVLDAEVALLRSRGHAVVVYSRDNSDIDSLGRLELLRSTIWSGRTKSEINSIISDFRPDVIHVHNTFPLISPSLYWCASERNIPVVQTLHNFRLLCPQAMLLRDGLICEDCLGNIPWRGAVRGCYRGSKVQSSVLAGMVSFHRAIGTWSSKIGRYIALNEFCRQKFIEGGLPSSRIVVKPNFVDFDVPAERTRLGFLFVGRLSPEKGISTLVSAIGGDGRLQTRVAGVGPESQIVAGSAGITWLGALAPDAVHNEMISAVALIMPSIWYENFPRTLVEAFGCGLPVIASRLGALAELIEDGVTGLLFDPGDGADLRRKMEWAAANPSRMADMGRTARVHYEANYTADRNYLQLTSIYRDVMSEARAH